MKGDFRYVFFGTLTDEDTLADLVNSLSEFLDQYESFGEYPSLVLLFRPPEDNWSSGDYKRPFWTVLRHLQENDLAP